MQYKERIAIWFHKVAQTNIFGNSPYSTWRNGHDSSFLGNDAVCLVIASVSKHLATSRSISYQATKPLTSFLESLPE